MPSKISKEKFEERLKNTFSNEKIKIIKYEKISGPCNYQCKKCGEVHQIYKASELLRKKHLCNSCFYGRGKGEVTKKQKEKALEIIKTKKLSFVSFGYNDKIHKNTIKIQCKKCNGFFEFQLSYFLKNSCCPYCSYNAKHLTTEGIKNRLPEDVTILGTYLGTDVKVLFRHEKCGFIWKTTPHNILSGTGCPKCNKSRSKGEQKIIKWLENNSILYEAEKIFSWSDQKRYDFFLPEEKLIIEYMGIQHYKDVPFFRRSLEEQKKIDKWKREQALLFGLSYLEISYENFENIDNILAQRLSRKESKEIEKEIALKGKDIV